MDSIKHGVQSLKHKGQQGGAIASKEANKSVAKDNNVRTSTRLHAAKNALSDKVTEQKHKREADVHKSAAKHNV